MKPSADWKNLVGKTVKVKFNSGDVDGLSNLQTTVKIVRYIGSPVENSNKILYLLLTDNSALKFINSDWFNEEYKSNSFMKNSVVI